MISEVDEPSQILPKCQIAEKFPEVLQSNLRPQPQFELVHASFEDKLSRPRWLVQQEVLHLIWYFALTTWNNFKWVSRTIKQKTKILEKRMLEIYLSRRNKGVVVPGSGANLMNEIVSLEQQMNLL